MEWTEETIQETVTQILSRLCGEREAEAQSGGDTGGVLKFATRGVSCEPFQGQERVRVRDLTTLRQSPHMAAGVMEVERTTFPWTLSYDEFDLILEGTLEILVNGKTISGTPGDVLYIPRGSSIAFQSPNKARFLYVTYPANWNAGG